MIVSRIVLLFVLGIAVITDVRSGKIKNWLTLPAILLGPIVHLIEGGPKAALSSLEAIGVMILVCVVLVALRIFGGGDIKLLVAVGSLAGMSLVKDSLLYTAVAGGVLAIVYMFIRRRAASVAKQMAQDALFYVAFKVKPIKGSGSGIKIPYSIAIAAGTIAAMILPA
ncbi:MAG: prepilin peptidase [Armatimonadota bacterium]|nr:prepilin peptidase [bacterium]